MRGMRYFRHNPTVKHNPKSQGAIHFANRLNFEQSLLKKVTSQTKSVTSAGSGQPQG
jgi:hypothetical protein